MVVNQCLVCGVRLTSGGGNRRRQVFPTELGESVGQVFQNVCKVLQVPFQEVQGEWAFTGNKDKLPFCVDCLNGFVTVIKLQQQLEEIRKKIEVQVNTIKRKIQDANQQQGADLKTTNFRLKALAAQRENVPSISSTNFLHSTNYSSFESVPSTNANQLVWLQDNIFNTCGDLYNPPISSATSESNTSAYQNFNQAAYSQDADDNNYSDGGEQNDASSNEEWTEATTTTAISKPPKSSSRALQQSRQPEYFAPIITDPHGRMTYEGITITPIANGYQCGACNAKVGKDHGSISLRKTKIHIKGFHLSAYQCTLCSKNFTSNDILNQHYTRIHDKTLVPCTICGKPMQDRYMKHHLFTHKNATEKQAALDSGFKLHGYVAKEPHLPCKICGKLFPKRGRLKRHEMSHVDAKFRKDHECPHCQKRFSDPLNLKHHIRVKHEATNLRKQLCKVCGELIIPKNMNFHMRKHKRYECPNCGKMLSCEKTVESHLKLCLERFKRPGYNEECDICGKCFPSRKRLGDHRRKAHGGKMDGPLVPLKLEGKITVVNKESIQCNVCAEVVKSVEEAYEHFRVNHNAGGRTYECDICGKTAMPQKGYKTHLWQHKSVWEQVEAVNRGEKLPLNWKSCESERMLKEVGIKVEIKCGICDKHDFEWVEQLHAHRWKEHPDVPMLKVKLCKNPKKMGVKPKYPEGPITCPRCGKEFGDSMKWRQHVHRVHKKEKAKVLAILRKDDGKESKSEEKGQERKRRKVVVEADEDEEDQQVEVKREVDSAAEEEEEENNIELRRKSLRNRGERKKISYQDEEGDDDKQEEEEELYDTFGIKQSPPSSSDEEDDENY